MDLSLLAKYAIMASFVVVPCWAGTGLSDEVEDEHLLTVIFVFFSVI